MICRDTPIQKALYFDLRIRDLEKHLPWIKACTNKFEVTNIGENYNLKQLLLEENIQLPIN